MQYARCKKLNSKGDILHGSTYKETWGIIMWAFWKRQSYRDGKQSSGFQVLGVKIRVDYKEVRGDLGADETVLYLHCGDGYTTYIFVKTPRFTW